MGVWGGRFGLALPLLGGDNPSVSKQRLLILGIALGIIAYGILDVRRRARVDRGARKHRTDFTVYQAAAQALTDGTDPYEARNPRGWRYVYPPLLAILLMPLAQMSPPNAAFLFFLLSMAAFLGALWLLRHMRPAAHAPPLGWRPVLLAALLCIGFAHQGFQRGQITHFLLLSQVYALWALLRGRYTSAGLAFAVGGVLRLTPLLPAGVAGLGLLVGLRQLGIQPVLRYAAGLLCGLLVLGFLLPVLVLGPERAHEVNSRWLEETRALYGSKPGELQPLEETHTINEFRFKNQAPRRVYATWTGWAAGAEFTRERPALSASAWEGIDRAAFLTGLLLLLGCAWLGAQHARPGGAATEWREPALLVLAFAVLAPVWITRYTWPTHVLMALPLVALAVAARSRTAFALLAGTALFYVAHAKALEPIGAAGCLFLGSLVFGVGFLLSRLRSARLPGAPSQLFLRLRKRSLRALTVHFPDSGLTVDLGAGFGVLARLLVEARPGRRVLAIDHDLPRVAYMRRALAGLPIEVRAGRMESVELPACMGIALVDVLHYFREVEQEALLDRAVSALLPGGVLVLRDPDAGAGLRFAFNRLHEQAATRLGFTAARLGHYRSAEEWNAALVQRGLRVTVGPPAKGPYADRIVVGCRGGDAS